MFDPPTAFVTDQASHVGLVRELNEDSLISRPDLGVWLVADGMGGYSGGDFASQNIVAHVAAIDPQTKGADLMRAMRRAMLESHQEIRQESGKRDNGTMGSTAVSLILSQGHFVCLWVGDSRLYHCRDGVVSQISSDHSLVNQLVQEGQLTPAQAENHPHGNVITRAIGVGDGLQVDKLRGIYEPGDRFLLCSDGLSGYLEAETLAKTLANAPMNGICERLIQGALDGGGRDNITAIVVEVPF